MINAYDKDELVVIKNKRYNEMILKSKGDLRMAQQFFNNEFPSDSDAKKLEDLLFTWAFEEDVNRVDITVKKFSILYLKKWIAKGFQTYADNYRKKEKEKIKIEIDSWQGECDENSFDSAQAELQKHYNKNRVWNTIKDKYILIFIGMAIASLVTLGITIIKFNKISLVIGILLGVVSGFLLWRRISDMQIILRARREKGYALLKKALEELKSWRTLYKEADKKNIDLVNVFENLEI